MFILDLKSVIFFILTSVSVTVAAAASVVVTVTVCLSLSSVFMSDSAAAFSSLITVLFASASALFTVSLSISVFLITVFNEKNKEEEVQILQLMCLCCSKQLKKTSELRCTHLNCTAKCSCCVQLNKSCHSISKKYFSVLHKIQKMSLIFLYEDFFTSLKKLMKIFTKKIEIYSCKIKKSANSHQDAEDISTEENLIEIMQKIEDHLNDLMKLQKYKLSVSMKKIQKFNTEAKKISEFCTEKIVLKNEKPHHF